MYSENSIQVGEQRACFSGINNGHFWLLQICLLLPARIHPSVLDHNNPHVVVPTEYLASLLVGRGQVRADFPTA